MTGMSKSFKKLLKQIKTMNAIKLKAKGMNDESSYKAECLIEVYCFAKKKQSKLSFLKDSNFALVELSGQLADSVDIEKPIFTDRQQAFNYGRYLDSSYCIVKAYAFDQAIESKGQALHLRKNYLQNTMVHGCFPSSLDARLYIKNHKFDGALLDKPCLA